MRCQACGKSFSTAWGRNRHFSSVHVGVIFTCDWCGDTFTLKASMVRHKRYVCPNQQQQQNNDNQKKRQKQKKQQQKDDNQQYWLQYQQHHQQQQQQQQQAHQQQEQTQQQVSQPQTQQKEQNIQQGAGREVRMERGHVPGQSNQRFGFPQNMAGMPYGTGHEKTRNLPPPPPLVKHGPNTSSAPSSTPNTFNTVDDHFQRTFSQFPVASAGVGIVSTSGGMERGSTAQSNPGFNLSAFSELGQRQPLTGQQQPLTGQQQPLTGQRQPLTGQQQPLTDWQQLRPQVPGDAAIRQQLRERINPYEHNISLIHQSTSQNYSPHTFQTAGRLPQQYNPPGQGFPHGGGPSHVSQQGRPREMTDPRFDVSCRMRQPAHHPGQGYSSNPYQVSGQLGQQQGQRLPPPAYQNVPVRVPTPAHQQPQTSMHPQGHGHIGLSSFQGYNISNPCAQVQGQRGMNSIQEQLSPGLNQYGMSTKPGQPSLQGQDRFSPRETQRVPVGNMTHQGLGQGQVHPAFGNNLQGGIGRQQNLPLGINIAEVAASLANLGENENPTRTEHIISESALEAHRQLQINKIASLLSNTPPDQKQAFINILMQKLGQKKPPNSALPTVRSSGPPNQTAPFYPKQYPVSSSVVSQNDASLIQTAFTVPMSSAATSDKEVLGRWYLPPSSEKSIQGQQQVSRPQGQQQVSRPSGTFSPHSIRDLLAVSMTSNTSLSTATATTTSTSHFEPIWTMQTSPVQQPVESDEPFVLKPTVCNEDVIEYKVADLLRCWNPKARSRHTSSVDGGRNQENLPRDASTVPTVSAADTGSQLEARDKTSDSQPSETMILTDFLRATMDTLPFSPINPAATRVLTPTSDSQFLDSGSVLDINKKRLFDQLVLQTEFGSLDVNPEIDIRNYLPSPGLPRNFVPSPSPGPSDFIGPGENPFIHRTLETTSHKSHVEKTPPTYENFPEAELGQGQGHLDMTDNHGNQGEEEMEIKCLPKPKESAKEDEVTSSAGKKRKSDVTSEDSDLKAMQPPKRARGRGRGQGRGRGRGRGARGTSRGRGMSWSMRLPAISARTKSPVLQRQQTARSNRGRGRGRGRASIESKLPLETKVSALDGHVIQKPQDLHELMAKLPHEELEKTTVSLSTLKMMLDWQKMNANVDIEDTTSVGSAEDADEFNMEIDPDNMDIDDISGDSNKQEKTVTVESQKESVSRENSNNTTAEVLEKDKSNDKEQSEEAEAGMEEDVSEKQPDKMPQNSNESLSQIVCPTASTKSLKSPPASSTSIHTKERLDIECDKITDKDENNSAKSDTVLEVEVSENDVNKGAKSNDNVTVTEKDKSENANKDMDVTEQDENKGATSDKDLEVIEQDKNTGAECNKNLEDAEQDKNKDAKSDKYLEEDSDKAVKKQLKQAIKKIDTQSCEKESSSKNTEGSIPTPTNSEGRIPAQVYSVTDTHKVTWVRYHGKTVTQLTTPDGNFFVMKEILRRCFRIQEPNKTAKFRKIEVLKKSVLKIPDVQLEPMFYDYVVSSLVSRKVIKTVPENFNIISEHDANSLFHHICKDQYCGGGCVTPFFSSVNTNSGTKEKTGSDNKKADVNKTNNKASEETDRNNSNKDKETVLEMKDKTQNRVKDNENKKAADKNNDNASKPGKQTERKTDLETFDKESDNIEISGVQGSSKKDRNLFDFIQETASPKAKRNETERETLSKKKRHKSGQKTKIIVVNLCSDEEDSMGYDSDKTFPYVDGEPLTAEQTEKLDIDENDSPIVVIENLEGDDILDANKSIILVDKSDDVHVAIKSHMEVNENIESDDKNDSDRCPMAMDDNRKRDVTGGADKSLMEETDSLESDNFHSSNKNSIAVDENHESDDLSSKEQRDVTLTVETILDTVIDTYYGKDAPQVSAKKNVGERGVDRSEPMVEDKRSKSKVASVDADDQDNSIVIESVSGPVTTKEVKESDECSDAKVADIKSKNKDKVNDNILQEDTVILIDDDDDDVVIINEEANKQLPENFNKTLDKLKEEVCSENGNTKSKTVFDESKEMVQVNNIDSTEEIRRTKSNVNKKLENFSAADKLAHEISSSDHSEVKDYRYVDDKVIVSDGNSEMEIDLTMYDTDSDVIIGDWVFPAPPSDYPNNGTQKLGQMKESLEKLIEKANEAKSSGELTDVLENVFKLTGPLKRWNNTLFDHYGEGLLIEVQRLKSLSQLQMTDPIDLDNNEDTDSLSNSGSTTEVRGDLAM